MFNSNASTVSGDANYIEDVFSTYLYTGTGANKTITNDIDLSTEGGLVWLKCRSDAWSHMLYDTSRGVQKSLSTNNTLAQQTDGTNDGLKVFNSDGFTLGSGDANVNNSGYTYTSWTFRKQPKFFDVVTYTGTGGSQTLNHSLGSTPGCIIVKRTSGTENWYVYHRSLNNNSNDPYSLVLNSTAAQDTGGGYWRTPTSTQFTVQYPNASGATYVAYLFAHDAGGFGLTGTDNVISCGSTTVASANAVVNLGYEPQFVLYKQSDGVGSWKLIDTMRGLTANIVANNSRVLYANGSNAEETNNGPALTSTGFILPYAGGGSHGNGNYIYIAIRRGPMKVPTDGTTVFNPFTRTGTGASAIVTGVGFAPDVAWIKGRTIADGTTDWDKLRGAGNELYTSSTAAEYPRGTTNGLSSFNNTGVVLGTGSFTAINNSGEPYINWFFQRAPSFFDEVCYAGTGSAAIQTHNLQAVPEMMIMKKRDSGNSWAVYHKALANTEYLIMNTTAAKATGTNYWNSTTPTSSVFTVGTASATNDSGGTFVSYLFATCSGVSNVGSYTGTGTTQQINCGFTAGSRFVMIKRTDSTGDWYVWDSARGIVAGNDPYLLLNSTAAEVTGTDYVDTYAAGFELTSTAPAALNASGGTYIFLAIA